MKATIRDYDIINKTSTSDGIEIGAIPKGVGLERMRWDGTKLVDLVGLEEIWVEYINNTFVLHSIKVPFSQLVKMAYKDRKKLWSDNGVYKIKSDEQIKSEINLKYRRSHYPLISDQLGAIMKYLETKNDLTPELQELIDKINGVKTKYPKSIAQMM